MGILKKIEIKKFATYNLDFSQKNIKIRNAHDIRMVYIIRVYITSIHHYFKVSVDI